MELSNYRLEDLILTALKSEIEARDFYRNIAERINNFLLKDRILFLSNEEEKHKGVLRKFLKKSFLIKKLFYLKRARFLCQA